MCGIFGYIGSKTNAASMVFEGLKVLEYRGYDSWGVGVIPNTTNPTNLPAGRQGTKNTTNKILIKKKAGKIGGENVDDLPKSSLAFGHTRWATHGGVTEINAHPHLSCDGKIALIHNGIIENYQELKEKLAKKGHKFISETDTEVGVHLIEEYAKKMMFSKACQKAFNEMAGLNAIIAIKADERQMIAVRNGSPLVIGFSGKENFLASDASALLPYTKQVYFLEDNQMAIIEPDKVEIYRVDTGEFIHPKKQILNWTVEQSQKGKFDYFMLKEIYEQPSIITNIAHQSMVDVKKLSGYIKKSYGTYMVACGSAAYACIVGSYLFSKIAKRHVNWAVGSEFSYQLDFLTPKSLVIALSQSGETMDTLEAVKKAKEKGAKIFALVNVLGSTLYRIADYKMLLGAGPEKGVASTKALIAKLSHLILLAFALIGKADNGQKVLLKAAKASEKVLGKASIDLIKALAKRLKKYEHIYVIARGVSYPAALETALKIKEISYIHAEGFAAGELKHGVIALIEKGTPCIAFVPNDETYGANLAGAMEMKARGGYIIGISHKPHEIFDYFIPVTDSGEATIIPNIIVGQLVAYYLTIERGFDPDKPRNLAKSVTVK